MIARKTSINELREALAEINKMYDGNVTFNRLEQKDGAVHFTLKVLDSKKPGHRLHLSYDCDGLRKQRRSTSACWHVHGDFFDALFNINNDATIRANTKVITSSQGNWEDWNIGSRMFPVYFSESCECN